MDSILLKTHILCAEWARPQQSFGKGITMNEENTPENSPTPPIQPEISQPAPPAPPPPPQYIPPAGPAPEQSVGGPAIGLVVTGVFGILGSVGGLLLEMLGLAGSYEELYNIPEIPAEVAQMLENLGSGATYLSYVFAIIVSVVIIIGGVKMKSLQSHGLAMTAAILALIPCVSPCCCIGIPVGIWALVVMMKPEVKQSFQ